MISAFRKSADAKEFIGERDTPSGRSLYIARPIKISNEACLRCHSTVDAAPKTLVEKYGPANGFGWNLNEVVGAQMVSVPMAVPMQRADRAFSVFMALADGGVRGHRRVAQCDAVVARDPAGDALSAIADRVSLGELQAPTFEAKSSDEIGVLAQSFTRMRKSLRAGDEDARAAGMKPPGPLPRRITGARQRGGYANEPPGRSQRRIPQRAARR